jgi:4-amino-4-deoxy-L-arabinose transferase-like glycosyltransferase
MEMTRPAAGARLSAGEWVLVVAIGYFVFLKLAVALFAAPVSDEAYYWMWGRHLSLSYFDHPPLGAWVQGLSHALFGTNHFALRLPTFLALGAVLAVFWAVAKRVGGEDSRGVFLRSTLVFVASPLFGIFGTVAIHDYLLVALVIGAGYFFTRYLTDIEASGDGRLEHLFGAAVLLGLAGLTKYTAAFVAIAVAGTILTRPKLRPMLLRWEIYAAGLIALALQAPTIIWNFQHDFASINFQFGRRFSDANGGLNIDRMQILISEVMALVSPIVIIPATLLFFWARQRNLFERVGKTLAIWAFWVPALTFLYVQNHGLVLWWWSAIVFALVLPFSGRYLGAIALGIHVFWGGVISTFIAVSFTIIPLTSFIGMGPMETEHMYGWDEVTARMLAAQREHSAELRVVNISTTASQLAFQLDDPDVIALWPHRNTFDDWVDWEAVRGKDAIVLVVARDNLEAWKAQFSSVQLLDEFSVDRMGVPLTTYQLWFAEDFAPLDGPAGRT